MAYSNPVFSSLDNITSYSSESEPSLCLSSHPESLEKVTYSSSESEPSLCLSSDLESGESMEFSLGGIFESPTIPQQSFTDDCLQSSFAHHFAEQSRLDADILEDFEASANFVPPKTLHSDSSGFFSACEGNHSVKSRKDSSIRFSTKVQVINGPESTTQPMDLSFEAPDSLDNTMDIFGSAEDSNGSIYIDALEDEEMHEEEEEEEEKEEAENEEKEAEEETEDKKIRRGFFYAIAGVGIFALFGLASKKISQMLGNSSDTDGGLDATNGVNQVTNGGQGAETSFDVTHTTAELVVDAAHQAEIAADVSNVSLSTSFKASSSSTSHSLCGIAGNANSGAAAQ
jgi:hypothetical protein